ncbi:hypothetical protein K1719_014226 [Acacia pycnantha]|nr:hypothetical protein K1719_014226 [Acacia pycnantha]
MTNLGFLSLSQNQFSGQIPESIAETCNSLLSIDLSSNNFFGRIPSSLANCSSLKALDLSNNNLSGAIPNSLEEESVMAAISRLIIDNNNSFLVDLSDVDNAVLKGGTDNNTSLMALLDSFNNAMSSSSPLNGQVPDLPPT